MIQISLAELPLWVSCIFFLLSMAFMYRQNKKLKKELHGFQLQQSIVNENIQLKQTEITDNATSLTNDFLLAIGDLNERIVELEKLPCARKMGPTPNDAERGFEGFIRGVSMVVGRVISDINDMEDEEEPKKITLTLEQQLKLAEDNQEFEKAAEIAELIKQKKGRFKR